MIDDLTIVLLMATSTDRCIDRVTGTSIVTSSIIDP
jgi:hypothetical protein